MSACDHPRCDGEIHWTGGKEADTGADEEEGACPADAMFSIADLRGYVEDMRRHGR